MGFQPLAIGGSSFWSSASKSSDVYIDGDLFYMVFDDSIRMDIIQRTKPELFSATVITAGTHRVQPHRQRQHV